MQCLLIVHLLFLLTCGAGDALASSTWVSEYDYTITVSSTPIGKVHWFVTDDANVMTCSGNYYCELLNPGDGTGDYVLATDAAI